MSLHRLLIALILGPELQRWKAAGHAPVLWWRDDDARAVTPALDRLLALSHRFAAPITVAAVPDGDIKALAKVAREVPGVELAIHGFRHENRAAAGLPFGEVNDQDRLADVMLELGTALDVFRRAGVNAGLFVPPWNNVHPTLKKALELQGLWLSGYGEAQGEMRLDAHLDIMRWKPEPRFRGALRFLLRARRLLVKQRLTQAWHEPIGLLTHHLDHDARAWGFLEAFLSVMTPVSRTSIQGASKPVRARDESILKAS